MEIDRMNELKENSEDKECKLSSNDVFVGGFSQGGAMAVYCGYHYPEKLGGVIALSSYVLETANYPNDIHPANKDTPLYACHGEADPVVPISYSQVTFNQLKDHLNMKYEKISLMQHEVYPQEIQNACKFVSNGGDLNDLGEQSKL